MEGADGLLGVQGELQPAGQFGLDMRPLLGAVGEDQAEATVEGERGGHVGGHQADHG